MSSRFWVIRKIDCIGIHMLARRKYCFQVLFSKNHVISPIENLKSFLAWLSHIQEASPIISSKHPKFRTCIVPTLVQPTTPWDWSSSLTGFPLLFPLPIPFAWRSRMDVLNAHYILSRHPSSSAHVNNCMALWLWSSATPSERMAFPDHSI